MHIVMLSMQESLASLRTQDLAMHADIVAFSDSLQQNAMAELENER